MALGVSIVPERRSSAWRRSLVRAGHGFILATADISSATLAALVSFILVSFTKHIPIGTMLFDFNIASEARMKTAFPLLAAIGIIIYIRGHYTQRLPFWCEAKELLLMAFLGVLVEGFLEYAVKEHVSRSWITSSWILFAPFVLLMRSIVKRSMLVLGLRTLRVLVIGAGPSAQRVKQAVESEPLLGYVVVACLKPRTPKEAIAIVRCCDADLAIIALSGEDGDLGRASAQAFFSAGVPYAVCPSVQGIGFSSMHSTIMFGHDVLFMTDRKGLGDPAFRTMKRAFDLVVSALLLMMGAVPLLIVGILAASDGGSPFYSQTRVGRHGRTFRLWKFRSMTVDADLRLQRLLVADPAARLEWERERKLRHDPRITAVGWFLRRSALDELPQLWNVFKGDMSLVGPRPVVESELERYGEEADAYLLVRPGVTGLWQVAGRNDVDYARRVALDAWYVRHWSFWNDLVVLFMTIPALLSRRGAY